MDYTLRKSWLILREIESPECLENMQKLTLVFEAGKEPQVTVEYSHPVSEVEAIDVAHVLERQFSLVAKE